jgi:hypothetical protein
MSLILQSRSSENRDCRPEMELILACCRNASEPAAEDAVLQKVNAGVDWDLLAELMEFHGVTLVVGRKLSVIGSSRVPKDLLERFRCWEIEAARQNLGQTVELLRIIELLQESGVDVIPFRGMALATQLYGELTLRQSSDIDLIIRRQDVLTVKRILSSAGYAPSSCLSPAQETAFIRAASVYELWNRDRNVRLELHWKDSQHVALPLPDDFVWKGCQLISFGGLQVITLAHETLLLLLCAHGTKHCWQQLRYVSDVAELVRLSRDIDWVSVLRKAAELGARSMVMTGLGLSYQVLGAPLPEEVLRDIRNDRQVQRIVAECSEAFFHGCQTEPGYWRTCQFNLRTFDDWRGRLRYLTRVALRPGIQDFKAASLPKLLFPLYPCIRLLRLIRNLLARPSQAAAGH